MAMVTPANAVYTYHFNAVGSTIAMTNASQNIVNKYSYDPFGNIAANSIETVPQLFKFVGQHGVMTEPNGFYYMRARYYDPEVGRFVSEDPLGFDGGDVNLYAYVGNNPMLLINPWGLRESSSFFGSIDYEQVLADTGDYSGTIAAGLSLSGAEPAAGINIHLPAKGRIRNVI